MLGIRWTRGDVSRRGRESLRHSIWSARGVFGADADYWVFGNTVSGDHARQLVDSAPDHGLIEGLDRMLAPLRCSTDRGERSLDGGAITSDQPASPTAWLEDEGPERCLLVEGLVPSDVGQFVSVCEGRALSSGIRGLLAGRGAGARVVDRKARRFGGDLWTQGG
jgi:hypothetical protein